MRDSRVSGNQNNSFNTEYRTYNIKASSWSEFTASKYLRNLVYAFVTAGSLLPASALSEEPPDSKAGILNTGFSGEKDYQTSKVVFIRQAVDDAEKATDIIRSYRSMPEGEDSSAIWIGSEDSDITTVTGNKTVKQSVTTEEIAGHIASILLDLKLKTEGKTEVAIGTSGSMPSLNTYARLAIKAAGCSDTSILSAASSQWGANQPDFTYPVIEKLLVEKEILPDSSVAASLGGKEDRALDVKKPEILLSAINQAGLQLINSSTIRQAIDQRMIIYGDLSKYLVYINVGGGIASVADSSEFRYPTGLIMPGSIELNKYKDCVIKRFLEAGIPVINLRHVSGDIIKTLSSQAPDSFQLAGSKE